MLKIAVMASGFSAQEAAALAGIVTACSATTSPGAPSGANQAAAPIIPSDLVILTGTSVGSGVGYKLPTGVDNASPGNIQPGDQITVLNQGGNTLLVYPNSATGKVSGGSAGAGFSVANNKMATFYYMGTSAGVDLWQADLSA